VKVGDLVKYDDDIGIVMCLDPEEIGDDGEVMVMWFDGEVCYHTAYFLEVISEGR
jgi:hypothetical protein